MTFSKCVDYMTTRRWDIIYHQKRNDQSTQEKTQRDLTCKLLNQRHDSKKNETVKNR